MLECGVRPTSLSQTPFRLLIVDPGGTISGP